MPRDSWEPKNDRSPVTISLPASKSNSTSASDQYARITRDMYNDWLSRFYPQQKSLMETTQNGQLLNEQLSRVDSNFSTSAQASQQANQHQMARFGLSSMPDTHSQAQTALAAVTSKNSLREHEKQRALSVLSGSGKSTLTQIEV